MIQGGSCLVRPPAVMLSEEVLSKGPSLGIRGVLEFNREPKGADVLLGSLNGDDPVQPCVSRLVHLAHTAGAEWFNSRMRAWLESVATPTVLLSVLHAPAQERRDERWIQDILPSRPFLAA